MIFNTKLIWNVIFFSILVVLIASFINSCTPRTEYEFPFQNPTLSMEDRVNDLVSRMTLAEKVGQMVNQAPAIERLGIPEYNWWNEGLHGYARAGLATVFPQAIGLGAMWDEEHMYKVSTAISDEARAKHHNFVKRGKRFLYQGLTLWSPNINIFRDPRWGRGQETYGEDPFLTGKMGVQFIKGLQGNDPTYFKTIATVKHFAVHNGPEPERHEFNATTNDRDLWETYLPQFEMGVQEGGAYSAMCAYNRYNEEACCGSSRLMKDILRNDMGFDGYIVSDCGAIEDIFNEHGLVETAEEAAALAVKSGCDLNCGLGEAIFPYLVQAVEKGLIDEESINTSVKRLFLARFKLGMFDPDEQVGYAQIPYSVVDSKENQDLSIETAKKSMVLLKNDGLLPLKKDLKKVGVIGPNANQWLMLLGNYNGVPSNPITPLEGIQAKLPDAQVLFAQGSELAEGMPMFYTIPTSALVSSDGSNGVNAAYFNNLTREGSPLYEEKVPLVDAYWGDKAPRSDMDDDNFSVRWTTTLKPTISGYYQLGFIGTSNTQLYLNDSLIAKTAYHFRDEYGDPRQDNSDKIWLEAGSAYSLKIETAETYADAQVQLVWAAPKPNLKKEAIDVANQSDVIIMCMGLTPRMEGEEMNIEIEGFRGGDRTKLGLPKVQLDLIKEIHALGKPIVLVLLNGSALAINWENDNLPAILEAWYPGQSAGTAIADILFGDYNPGGKLPVTFYQSVEDLPPFEQYDMTGHTYRYFKGEPLYPFGFGLSYTQYQYSNLVLDSEATVGDSVAVSVTVTNTGAVTGEEVVQLYVKNLSASVPTPIRNLKGFDRIRLQPGESKEVNFVLPSKSFQIVNEAFERVVVPGEFEIAVGGGQPNVKLTTSNTLTANLKLIN